MIITNKYNIPANIARYMMSQTSRPSPDVIRVTALIAPPLMRHLMLTKWSEITVDISEYFWMIYGTGVHAILERAGTETAMLEIRHSITVGNIIVSGQTDWYDEGAIIDNKTTSVWAAKFGAKSEWEKQLNVYAHLWRQNGYPVASLGIYAFYRDWVKPKTYRDHDYPEIPFQAFDIPLWDAEKARIYVAQRVALHSLPPEECTKEEKWHKPDIWAVKKKGNKTAISGGLCTSENDAYAVVAKQKNKCEVEYRPGGNTRCQIYCQVRSVCPYTMS
jgi:hypothetical protein